MYAVLDGQGSGPGGVESAPDPRARVYFQYFGVAVQMRPLVGVPTFRVSMLYIVCHHYITMRSEANAKPTVLVACTIVTIVGTLIKPFRCIVHLLLHSE